MSVERLATLLRLTAGITTAAATILVAVAVQCSSSHLRKAQLRQRPPVPQVSAPMERPPGPALEPRGIAAVRPTRAGETIGFTQDDLLNFVQSHPIPKITKTGTDFKVSRLDCAQTAKSVAGILRGKTVGLPDATPVCYVEMKRDFAITTPPSKRNFKRQTLTFNTSFEVFDSRTGNLILSGGFLHPPLAPK